MIEELAILINDFPGPANQTRCLHIINLVVKSIIQQFDLPTSKKKSVNEEDNDEDLINEAAKELLKLAKEIEHEEEITANCGDEEDVTEDDNVEGWVDECEDMMEAELQKLAESVKLVRLLLGKVC